MKKVKKKLQLNKLIVSTLNAPSQDQTRKIVGGEDSDACFCTIDATECIQIGCGLSAPACTNGPTEANVCWPAITSYTLPTGIGGTGGGGYGSIGTSCWDVCYPKATGDTGGGGYGGSWNPLYCY
jgi:hypothetical protein